MAQEYPPSREEWQEWQAHPVTKWFRWAVGEVITDYRKAIGDGHTLRANSDDTAQETARQVGFVTGLQAALDAEPEVVEADR